MRTIVAQLTSLDGTPRASITVTRYTASAPVPGRPSALRVRHVGTTLRITFRPASGATRQVVSVRLSDGRGLVFVLGGRATGVTVKAVPKTVHATSIVVRGLADGIRGPAATTRGG